MLPSLLKSSIFSTPTPPLYGRTPSSTQGKATESWGAQHPQEPGPDGVEDDEDNEWLLDQIDALILQARTNAAADPGAN